MWWFTLLVACHAPPSSLPECTTLSAQSEQEECRFRLIQPIAEDDTALTEALKQVPEGVSRDLLLLRLAIENPPRAARLCRRVSTEGAKTRCQQVLGRPHLQTTRRAPVSEPQTP